MRSLTELDQDKLTLARQCAGTLTPWGSKPLPRELTLIARIERFERAHTDFLISAPYSNGQNRWLVRVPGCGEPEAFEFGLVMITELERRYPQ